MDDIVVWYQTFTAVDAPYLQTVSDMDGLAMKHSLITKKRVQTEMILLTFFHTLSNNRSGIPEIIIVFISWLQF